MIIPHPSKKRFSSTLDIEQVFLFTLPYGAATVLSVETSECRPFSALYGIPHPLKKKEREGNPKLSGDVSQSNAGIMQWRPKE